MNACPSEDAARNGLQACTAKHAINAPLNSSLSILVSTALGLQLFVWPALLRHFGIAALLLGLPFICLTPLHWGLIHEAIHGQLCARRRLNDVLGRGLAMAFPLPFEAMRFGHLMHHRFTREPYDCPDIHDGTTPFWLARLAYLARLLGGLYIAELMLPLLACLPPRYSARHIALAIGSKGPAGADVQRRFVAFTENPARRRRIRYDAAMSAVLYGSALVMAGRWWPAIVGTLYLRGVWLSLADNLPHFDVPLDTPKRARNFLAPAAWRGILMNHHLHQLHHRYPIVPWSALPEIQRDEARSNHAVATAYYFRTALRQFSGFQRKR